MYKKKKNMIMILTIAVSILGFTGLSIAASTSSTMTVSGNVAASCTVGSIGSVTFPSFSGAAVPFSNTLDVTCTIGTPYTISLDAGANATACQRRSTNGTGGYLKYNLYRDTELMSAWGDGATCGYNKSGIGNGGLVTHTVYGQVPVQSVPPPGSYSDTITVTVNY